MHYISYPSLAYPYFHPRLATTSKVTSHVNTALDRENSFPPVKTKRLNTSAQRFQVLMEQADLLIDKIISSNEFAYELKTAAQLSETKKVEELILSTGITIEVETKFTPSGIQINLKNSDEGGSCCDLLMTLQW